MYDKKTAHNSADVLIQRNMHLWYIFFVRLSITLYLTLFSGLGNTIPKAPLFDKLRKRSFISSTAFGLFFLFLYKLYHIYTSMSMTALYFSTLLNIRLFFLCHIHKILSRRTMFARTNRLLPGGSEAARA